MAYFTAGTLASDCPKCNRKKRETANKVLRHLIENKKALFDELEAKYDPEGVYRKKYEAEDEKEGINI